MALCVLIIFELTKPMGKTRKNRLSFRHISERDYARSARSHSFSPLNSLHNRQPLTCLGSIVMEFSLWLKVRGWCYATARPTHICRNDRCRAWVINIFCDLEVRRYPTAFCLPFVLLRLLKSCKSWGCLKRDEVFTNIS